MTSSTHIHFVTGKLAETALIEVVKPLSEACGFTYSIDRLPITVAALITPEWLLRHVNIPPNATQLLLPGHLKDRISDIQEKIAISVVCGPRDLRDLPLHFGRKVVDDQYGKYSIEIIAEINHANRMRPEEILKLATRWREEGANRIDLGCEPGIRWSDVQDRVKSLVDLGFAVSIDTFDSWEVREAVAGGATLVLSVNQSNAREACDWGAEVVVVPDRLEHALEDLTTTVHMLESSKVAMRLDPILEPIGCGFARSLHRYIETRNHFPDAPMMMGIGNISELTDVDSAGVNTLLLGFCEELQIGSVLTTEVIPWARSSVRECDAARKLVHYAVSKKIPAKRINSQLVMLRDDRVREHSPEFLEEFAGSVKDNNYRIFVAQGKIHLIAAGVHLVGEDPFEMMNQLLALPESRNVDPGHAFYLGYELCKALTSITLGKNYEQDEALKWGLLTRPENRHRIAKKPRNT